MPVNYARIALGILGATVAYFVCGFVMFGALPAMKSEFMKYPKVYRSHDDMMKVMPYGMVAILISIMVVAIVYAKIYPAGGGIASGVYLGALIGIFSVCTFVIRRRSHRPHLQAIVDSVANLSLLLNLKKVRLDRRPGRRS
jgi:hypothetical protein